MSTWSQSYARFLAADGSPRETDDGDDDDTAALVSAFEACDVDGSGQVDAREILQLALDLGVEITLQEMHLIFGEIDLDGSGAIDFDEFAQWYLLKGGRGDVLRRSLREWYKQIDSANDAQVVSISFERGKGLQGTKRVKGKVTYYFSR
eukprot:COSAG06_NODE_34468_length_474_cov_0.690667_1_plen_148_part_01